MSRLMVGVRNFIVVGIPSMWGKVRGFFGKISNVLMGRNSPLRSRKKFLNTLNRIMDAFTIGLRKKAVGAVADILMGILNMFVPGAGSVVKIIITIVPALMSFIMTQVMLLKKDAELDSEMKLDAARRVHAEMG